MALLIPILILMIALILVMMRYIRIAKEQYHLHIERKDPKDNEALIKMIISISLAVLVVIILIALVYGIRRLLTFM